MAPRGKRLLGLISTATLLMVLSLPEHAALGATYGTGNYGGAQFGAGEEPSRADNSGATGGGVVIGGPLGIGYVVSNSSATTTICCIETPSQLEGSGNATQQFSRSLHLGDAGEDVRRLQVFLNGHGFVLAKSGPGSPGLETNRFGSLTYGALVRLQEANRTRILLPLGLSRGTGLFGSSTRAFVNEMLH